MKKNLLRSQKGATLFEAAIVMSVLIIFILIGLDLVRITYANAIAQYFVTRNLRISNLEANVSVSSVLPNCGGSFYTGCAACAVGVCCSTQRACALRQKIIDDLKATTLRGEFNVDATAIGYFTIQSIVPGTTTVRNNDTGAPGDFLTVDLQVPVNLIFPIWTFFGAGSQTHNNIMIRASSIGRNEN